MPDYAIFGHCLRSAIAFPELRAIEEGTPRWTLRVSRRCPRMRGARLLGTEDLGGGSEVHLYKCASGFRVAYEPESGAFDVSGDGHDIVWRWVPGASEEMVRLHVLGRVLATALHASGVFCLHGSGVALDGGAIAFLAPRFWGKSTLAMALVQAGARLLSDDTLAAQPDDAPLRLWPGVHGIRLWEDAAERVAGGPTYGSGPLNAKRFIRDLAESQLASRPERLAAIYLLSPTEANGSTPAACRTLLSPVTAAVSLVGQAKIGPLLGKTEAPVLLDRAVRVSRTVSVYRLAFARHFDRIPEVVAQIIDWHRNVP
jgi:hypothetical protein